MAATKTKAELWREVKILSASLSALFCVPETNLHLIAFTRTLTTLYSLTLLSLFSHIQLSLLGRSKYVQSVLGQEREERMREKLSYQLSIYSLFWSQGPEECESELLQDVEPIDQETEMMYLTLSWWICHIGWKDVGERVRRGVEEVFDEYALLMVSCIEQKLNNLFSVSLKTKLGAMDLHRLVCDVRRRVEHEITFEGQERKIKQVERLTRLIWVNRVPSAFSQHYFHRRRTHYSIY